MGTSIGERLKQFYESNTEYETVSVCLALDGPMGSNSWRQGRIEWIAEDTVCLLDTDGKRESVFSLGNVVSYSVTRKVSEGQPCEAPVEDLTGLLRICSGHLTVGGVCTLARRHAKIGG